MWILRISYIVKFCVESSIVVTYDQLVFAPILSQMIESFAEVADLGFVSVSDLGFVVWVVLKCNFKFLVEGIFKFDSKAVGSKIFMID